MIEVNVFLLILTPTEFRWVYYQKENIHFDHIPSKLKRIINLFVRVSRLRIANLLLEFLAAREFLNFEGQTFSIQSKEMLENPFRSKKPA